MRTALVTALLLATGAAAADLTDLEPNVFPKDDPRAKELPRMMATDARRRMQEANLRESRAFAAVSTRQQWEAHRDERIKALRASLGEFPEPPKDVRVVVTGKLAGDGYRIHNLVYETRPGLWANANLYLPATPPARMPGFVIVHSHHTPNTHGELQDMGMTWARAGCAVLVPELLGHGERRQHRFTSEKDYPKPFRPGRQDYYFRYNSALQLSLVGESLLGWFVWDLMRGIDVLLTQPNIDPSRVILLGAVAGGGDPAGVTAALDPRVACLVPFNFGGWQPESVVPENPDRDFAWFGEGYWETTRGLRNGARDGFAHYVIVGSMAPRPVVYAHEFEWDAAADPAWPRLRKIYGLYDARERLAVAHGAGSVRGEAGPDNTHCTHIGAPHRSMIYPALKAWFDIPIPEEYSKRRPAEELRCWTDAARAELQPRMLHDVLTEQSLRARERAGMELAGLPVTQLRTRLRERWAALLGPVEPVTDPNVTAGREVSARGMGLLTQYVLEVEPGGYVPVVLLKPVGVKGTLPVVVTVAQTGNQPALVVERADVWAALLRAGVAVCLVDVRGTGESRPGGGSPDRGGARTSVAQTNLVLGTPAAGMQLRDLRTVLRWVRARDDVDGTRVAVWGDSLSPVNPPGRDLAAPLDAPDLPAIAEPGGALLAELAELYEDGLAAVVARGGLTDFHSVLTSPYPYVPFDAVVPGVIGPRSADLPTLRRAATVPVRREGWGDGQNRRVGDDPPPATETVRWVVERLTRK